MYHATLTGNVKAILEQGLVGDPSVNLSEMACIDELIHHLYGLDGFYQLHHGHDETVTLLEVDVTGLELDGPRTQELRFSPDNDEHHRFFGTIPPDRITSLGVTFPRLGSSAHP